MRDFNLPAVNTENLPDDIGAMFFLNVAPGLNDDLITQQIILEEPACQQ